MPTKAQLAEREEAKARLREWGVKPGDTLHTILRHVSKSGMSRVIDIVKLQKNGEVVAVGWNAAKAMGDTFDRDRDGIKVGGCGMDMGFHVVYNLSYTLFPKGFGCTGEKCPSNDHTNGDRNREKHTKAKPHWHNDGGYALRQRWL